MVKILDLSNLLKHAFESGKALGDWVDYEPDTKAYDRVSKIIESGLLQAANDVIESSSDIYKKRNGHLASFEDDTGEKAWIVPFDAFEGLRDAIAAATPNP